MFDLDIRIIGRKQSRQMYQFYTFNTHEECISAVMKCIELVTNFYECDSVDAKFRSYVTTPDTITLYSDERTIHAVFRIVERKGHAYIDSRTISTEVS